MRRSLIVNNLQLKDLPAAPYGVFPSLPSSSKGYISPLSPVLPLAKAETNVLHHFQLECDAITNARKLVYDRMTQRVTARLPSLEMDTTPFHVDIQRTPRRCTNHLAYGNGSTLGLDSIEFLLLHGTDSTDPLLPPSEKGGNGGRLTPFAAQRRK